MAFPEVMKDTVMESSENMTDCWIPIGQVNHLSNPTSIAIS